LAAILEITANQLAGAIRLVSLAKGHDPRDFILVACGGAGPLHAVALARELGVPTVLVPYAPGLASALGCALADVRHDFVQTVNLPLLDANPATIDRIFAQQRADGERRIAREHITLATVEAAHEVDVLYSGQSHLFRVPIDGDGFDPALVATRFAERYRERFAIELPEMRAVLVNVRTAVVGRRPPFDLQQMTLSPSGTIAEAQSETRPVSFAGAWHETPVYRRERLPHGVTIVGPAIVEQTDATSVIDPGALARVDGFGNLIITVRTTGEAGRDDT
jgi:N-methylhydantoinase A